MSYGRCVRVPAQPSPLAVTLALHGPPQVRLFGQCLATDPSTSMYYNMPPSYTLGDLQKEEVLR